MREKLNLVMEFVCSKPEFRIIEWGENPFRVLTTVLYNLVVPPMKVVAAIVVAASGTVLIIGLFVGALALLLVGAAFLTDFLFAY